MKQGLSKREKVMIFVAAAALLIFLSFQYGLSPLYSYYSEKSVTRDALALDKSFMEIKLLGEEGIRANHKQAESEFNDIKERYPDAMPNEAIDRILTDLCLRNNLNPVGLEISPAVEFYANMLQDEQATEEASQDASSQEEENKKPPAFLTIDAEMSLAGDYPSLKRLIDAVEKLDYIRIKHTSFVYGAIDPQTHSSNILVLFEFTVRNDKL